MSASTPEPDPEQFLGSTWYIDAEDPVVVDFARSAAGSATDPVTQAAALFAEVRDRIRYDPYLVSDDPQRYRASQVAVAPRAYCIPKAVLLTAAARALGIPARLGFADVRNHLQTPALRERMKGSDLFLYHGYSELWLQRGWVKATPAFNVELCARFGVEPIEFDGREDALLHQFSADGSRHMEYVHDRGWYHDLPLDDIVAAFRASYGEELLVAGRSAPVDSFTA